MTTLQRTLFIVYEAGNFLVARDLCLQAREANVADGIIWCPYYLPETERYKRDAEEIRSVYIHEVSADGKPTDFITPLNPWLIQTLPRLAIQNDVTFEAPSKHERWWTSILRKPSAEVKSSRITAALAAFETLTDKEKLNVRYALDRIERRIRFCEDWLTRLGIDTILFAEDNTERDSYAWIAAAKRRGVKTMVVTYGALSETEALHAYQNSPRHQLSSTMCEHMQANLPWWIGVGSEHTITRLPYVEAISRELSGTSPLNPWLVNSGDLDAICLESKHMLDVYISFGFDVSKLYDVGHIIHDKLFDVASRKQSLRRELLIKHGYNETDALVLVAMPPNQTHRFPNDVFEDYQGVIDEFARRPSQMENVAVIVTPHPNLSQDVMKQLMQAGICIETTTAASLIPLADLYIACVSSTIKWSLACGIPVIDFDCFGYHYPDYIDLEQVITARSVGDYHAALKRWQSDDGRSQLEEAAQSEMQKWGRIDGRAMERILGLM